MANKYYKYPPCKTIFSIISISIKPMVDFIAAHHMFSCLLILLLLSPIICPIFLSLARGFGKLVGKYLKTKRAFPLQIIYSLFSVKIKSRGIIIGLSTLLFLSLIISLFFELLHV